MSYDLCKYCQWFDRTPNVLPSWSTSSDNPCHECYPKGDEWIHRKIAKLYGGSMPHEYPKHIQAFEFTFTTDTDDLQDLITRMSKVLKSKMLNAVHYYIGFELTDKKLPHAHVMILSNNKKVEYSKLKTIYSPKKGAVHTDKVKNKDALKTYIQKQHTDPEIINYFTQKNVPLYISTNKIEDGVFQIQAVPPQNVQEAVPPQNVHL